MAQRVRKWRRRPGLDRSRPWTSLDGRFSISFPKTLATLKTPMHLPAIWGPLRGPPSIRLDSDPPGIIYGSFMNYVRERGNAKPDIEKESAYAYRYIYGQMAEAFNYEPATGYVPIEVQDLRAVFVDSRWAKNVVTHPRRPDAFFLGFLEAYPKCLQKFIEVFPELIPTLVPRFSGNLSVEADRLMDRGLLVVNPSKRKKASAPQLLIDRCHKLWDAQCASPTKKNLRLVFAHLEMMKASTSGKVKAERSRCLRAANKEAKRLGMKK